jgi:hypothetical protein
MAESEKQCSFCKATQRTPGVTKMSKCSRCRVVFYCSKSCQRMDWNLHKTNCSRLCIEALPPTTTTPKFDAILAGGTGTRFQIKNDRLGVSWATLSECTLPTECSRGRVVFQYDGGACREVLLLVQSMKESVERRIVSVDNNNVQPVPTSASAGKSTKQPSTESSSPVDESTNSDDDDTPWMKIDSELSAAKYAARCQEVRDANGWEPGRSVNLKHRRKYDKQREENMSTMNAKARKKFLRRENKAFQKLLSKALRDNKVRDKKIQAVKKREKTLLCYGCKEMKSMSGIFMSCTTCCQKHWCKACGGNAEENLEVHFCGQCMMQTCSDCAKIFSLGCCLDCRHFTCVKCEHDCDTNSF